MFRASLDGSYACNEASAIVLHCDEDCWNAATARSGRAAMTARRSPSQQELLVLVAARLAAVPHGRARVRGEHGRRSTIRRRGPSCCCCRRRSWCRCLTHDGVKVWDTLAIAEYLNEIEPEAGLLPADRVARAHCRAVSGEMHSGFANLRSALPMNLKARHAGFKVWAGAQADIERVDGDLARVPASLRRALPVRRAADHGGRHVRAGVHALRDLRREARCGIGRISRPDAELPAMLEWTHAAKSEPEEVEELDVEF